MAVEIKYVVIREGEEKMSFASKKEADAYDKMLDLAEILAVWLRDSPLTLEEQQHEALALWLAGQRDVLATIIKSGRLPEAREDGLAIADVKQDDVGGKATRIKPAKAA